MSNLKIGDKVEYRLTEQHEWAKGVIHGIKKAQDTNDRDLTLGYLIDTGKDERVDEIVTEKGKDNILVRQPEQVEVMPDNIRLKNK